MTSQPPVNRRRSGNLSIIPAAAVFDDRLSAADIRVLAALGAYADKEGRCWPATSTIASRTGISERYVRTCLRNLEGFGYLKTEPRSGQTSVYRIPRNYSSAPEPHCRGPRKPSSGDPGTTVPPNDTNNGTKNDYAFSGAIIRLTWRDFAKWQEAYKAIPDLRAALQQRDDWLATLPESDRRQKNWLVPTSNWLAKENQKQVGQQASAELAYDPDVIH